MTDRTQPEALRLAAWLNEGAWHQMRLGDVEAAGRELRRQHTRIAELESELEAVGAGGVQALSAAPADVEDAIAWLVTWKGGEHTYVHAHASELPAVTQARVMGGAVTPCVAALAASPTPTAEQAAPKAAPGVGNSGFDHQTAADILSGKTVSDEALRKFVQASRWAHDEKAALSAMLLSVRGELASREAEIALLKKALLEAETAPQPAPAPLSDDAKDAARWRMVVLIGNEVMLHPEKRTQAAAVKAYMDATHSGSDLTGAVDAALAAQGGKT